MHAALHATSLCRNIYTGFRCSKYQQNETKGVLIKTIRRVADNPDGLGPVNVTILTFVTVFINVILSTRIRVQCVTSGYPPERAAKSTSFAWN